jgi:DNA-binding FrmR family transcriptional regulator
MERKEIPDRQFDAMLERLDRIAGELERLNRNAEASEALHAVAREVRNLNESLNALAYAALGQSPTVRRRRAG